MKNAPPSADSPSTRPVGFSAAILSWFIYPGMGQAAVGRKGRGQAWGLVFTVLLVGAMVPLLSALGDIYSAATQLTDIPASNMPARLLPAVVMGALAFVVWLACGLDAWALAGKQKGTPPVEEPPSSPPDQGRV